MTIHDNELNESAKAANGEARVVANYATFSTTDLTITPSMTFTGEIPARFAITQSRVNNVVTATGIRSGTAVGSSVGETLYEAALNSAATSGTFLAVQGLPSILHTTNFDLEINWDKGYERD